MKSNSKKKKLLAAAAGLAVVAAVTGTFAWITAQDQRINRVKAAAITDGSVTISEDWKPKPIIPGTEADKQVEVTNSGSVPVFVRVSYEEVLTHLASLGVQSNAATGFDPGTATFNSDVAVEFDGDKYITDASYVDITAKVTSGGNPLPANVKVFGKGSVTVDPITSSEKTDFSYAMFFEYATGKYQAMSQTVSVTGGNTAGSNINTWTFDASALEYKVYAAGYDTIAVNWAESSLPDAAGAATGYALLGTEGTKYGEAYDYTVGGDIDITALPTTTPQTFANAPQADADVKPVQADRIAPFSGTGIEVKYGTAMVVPTALEDSHWVYNEDDGYFYFTSPIGTGESTPALLEKLVFNSTVDDKYTNATYDLVVKMEAIQATESALTDTAGWALEDASGVTTAAILAYLANQGI